MKVDRRLVKTCRLGGGLFLGVRFEFPCGLCACTFHPVIHWRQSTLSIGLLTHTLYLDFMWNFHTREDGC